MTSPRRPATATLSEIIAASVNEISEAQYATQNRSYTRYYIELEEAPHAIVIYVDIETGQLTDNPTRFEQSL